MLDAFVKRKFSQKHWYIQVFSQVVEKRIEVTIFPNRQFIYVGIRGLWSHIWWDNPYEFEIHLAWNTSNYFSLIDDGSRLTIFAILLLAIFQMILMLITGTTGNWHHLWWLWSWSWWPSAKAIMTICTSEKTNATSWASPIIPILMAATDAGPHWNFPL